MVKLIVFRDKDYYRLSGTMLSPIVHDTGSVGSWEDPDEPHYKYERCDWGFTTLNIEAGLEVSFRRATDQEIEEYTNRLKTYRRDFLEDSTVSLENGFPVYKIANQNGFGRLIKAMLGLDQNDIT